MTLQDVYRLHDLGHHAQAYSALRELMEDRETDPHLLRALKAVEPDFARLVPADPWAWFKRKPKVVRG